MNWRIRGRGKNSIAIFITVLSVTLSQSLFAQEGLDTVNRDAPDFSLSDIDNRVWDLGALEGQFWVINFWATWCPPCIEEIPSMNRAWEALEPHGVGMLAINAGEDRPVVEEFLTKVPIDFTTLLGSIDTLPNWSVRALPTTIVVNRNGEVIFEALGPREWDDEELLQRVIDLL